MLAEEAMSSTTLIVVPNDEHQTNRKMTEEFNLTSIDKTIGANTTQTAAILFKKNKMTL